MPLSTPTTSTLSLQAAPAPAATPSPSLPFAPSSASAPAPADLSARGLAFFRLILDLVVAVFTALVERFSSDSDPHCDCIKTMTAVIDILRLLVALEITLAAAPQRVTPLQLVRLSAAAGLLARLTGRTFDFSPWTRLTPSQLAALEPSPDEAPSQSEFESPSCAPALPSTPSIPSIGSIGSIPSISSGALPHPQSGFPRPNSGLPRPARAGAYPTLHPRPSFIRPQSSFAPSPAPSAHRPPASARPRRRTSGSSSSADSSSRITFSYLPNPGDTLVRIIVKLVRLLPPDFSPEAIASLASIPTAPSIGAHSSQSSPDSCLQTPDSSSSPSSHLARLDHLSALNDQAVHAVYLAIQAKPHHSSGSATPITLIPASAAAASTPSTSHSPPS